MSQYQGWGQPGQQPGGPGEAPTPWGGMPTAQERQWAMIAHLSPLVLGFIGPLVLMLMDPTGQPSVFVKHAAKQSLIWSIILIVVAIFTCGIGGIVMMIFQVLAGVAANKGEWYVYPGCAGFVDQQPV
jgi:uncharacterized protein